MHHQHFISHKACLRLQRSAQWLLIHPTPLTTCSRLQLGSNFLAFSIPSMQTYFSLLPPFSCKTILLLIPEILCLKGLEEHVKAQNGRYGEWCAVPVNAPIKQHLNSIEVLVLVSIPVGGYWLKCVTSSVWWMHLDTFPILSNLTCLTSWALHECFTLKCISLFCFQAAS